MNSALLFDGGNCAYTLIGPVADYKTVILIKVCFKAIDCFLHISRSSAR